MGRSSLKQLEAIELPHDGPLNHVYKKVLKEGLGGACQEEGETQNDDETLQSSLHFLLSVGDLSREQAAAQSPYARLVEALLHPANIQDQLHALQSFRSTLLQQQNATPTEDASAVYRILWEWAIGFQTPQPLRKAIQYGLQTVYQGSDCPKQLEHIQELVLTSICLSDDLYWKDPLHSLQEGLALMSLNELPVASIQTRVLTYLEARAMALQLDINTTEPSLSLYDRPSLEKILEAVQVASLIKTLLLSKNNSTVNQSTISNIQSFLWDLVQCPAAPADSLSIVGIAYARALFWTSDDDCDLPRILSNADTLPDLSKTAVLQGVAATVPDSVLVLESALLPLMESFSRLALQAADPDVRLSALKGLRTLTSRCISIRGSWQGHVDTEAMQSLANQTLNVVFSAWENPPTRKLASSIPSLFESVIQLMRLLDESFSFDNLVQRLLEQPPNRKGRYLALETLLPITGASTLLKSEHALTQDLLLGIGDHGHSTGPIVDLWAKILGQLLVELQEKAGIPSLSSKKHPNRKQRLKMEKHGIKAGPDEEADTVLVPEWVDAWAPSLAEALLSAELSRRKQIAAFCLPRIVTMVGGPAGRSQASQAFVAILSQVQRLAEQNMRSFEMPSKERETYSDRVLWAHLEIARLAASHGLLDSRSVATAPLRDKLAKMVPVVNLRLALIHFAPTIRIVAFQAMSSLVETYDPDVSGFSRTKKELELWKESLPFAIKTGSKEYLASLLHCVLLFLDRLSCEEAATTAQVCKDAQTRLPVLYSFAVDFLLDNIIVKKAAYPGSTDQKEAFALALLECIIAFTSRGLKLSLDSKLLPKTGAVFQRKRHSSEEFTIEGIRRAILGREIMGSMFSLLHSTWDSIRKSSFEVLSAIVAIGIRFDILLPIEYSSAFARRQLESRGMYLASSPRQREADTGARILAFIYLAGQGPAEKGDYLKRLVDTLEHRINGMKQKFVSILVENTDVSGGRALPLAHGFLQSFRLIAEAKDVGFSEESNDMYRRMMLLFCRAIQVSLSVVADVKDGEVVDGMDEEIAFGLSDSKGRCRSTKGKINPGAIGANGIFSSITRMSSEEYERRIASQRLVVGSWLLTKETVGAMAALLRARSADASVDTVNEVGMLLVSTLTSLKHAGAAFAAHRALQQIVLVCFTVPSLQRLPEQWADRLLDEISATDKVRDSTLRRSTGYALGFLSIMRSEVSSRAAPRPLCLYILKNVMRLAVPSEGWITYFLKTVRFRDTVESLFLFLSGDGEAAFVGDDEYAVRTRVHALNVLRLMVLDAPLSQEIFPLVGDAIIAAVMGYTDSEWAVRNSSTMVFAAAMLRVVDADKNASNSDSTSRNAITFAELYRSYPPLPEFLLTVMKGVMEGLLGNRKLSLPPIYPILLLLSRIQPIAASGHESISLIEPFVPVVFRCLGHEDIGVRKEAARALANIVTGEREPQTSLLSVLIDCKQTLLTDSDMRIRRNRNWNELHGTLLAVRELTKSFPGTSQYLQELELDACLMQLTKVDRLVLSAPPLCLSVALEILSEISCTAEQKKELVAVCLRIMYVPNSGRLRHTDNGAAAQLGTTAAIIACQIVSSSIWNPLDSEEDIRRCCTVLSHLFGYDGIDVRLPAVKVFKKSIYDGLDTLLEHPSENREEKSGLLVSLISMLSGIVKKEMQRKAKPDDPIGSHPPTLRRLSRCLLECLMAWKQLSFVMFEIQEDVWDIGISLTEEAALSRDDTELPAIVGNAVELLAFGASFDEGRWQVEDGLRLSQLVRRLSRPTEHWRVRHSAALCLDISGVLRSSQSNVPDSIRREVLIAGLELLQDGDVDVRYAATRAISASFTSNVVPEIVLSDLTKTAFYSCFEMMTTHILETCEGVEEKIASLYSELIRTADAASASDLLNLGAERKIFEEEDPNLYREPCYSIQMDITAALQSENTVSNQTWVSVDRVLALCQRVLALILRNVNLNGRPEADFIHDITRFRTIFPELHCLLVGSSCCLILGAKDTHGVKELAETVLGSSSMHPCIHQALQVLSSAAKGNKALRESLIVCCFLLSPFSL